MWVRKTVAERLHDTAGRIIPAIIFALFAFILLFGMMAVSGYFGCEKPRYHAGYTINQLRERIPYYATAAFCAGVITFIYKLFIDNADEYCDRCSRVRRMSDRRTCSCGGSFVSSRKYKWVA